MSDAPSPDIAADVLCLTGDHILALDLRLALSAQGLTVSHRPGRPCRAVIADGDRLTARHRAALRRHARAARPIVLIEGDTVPCDVLHLAPAASFVKPVASDRIATLLRRLLA